MMMEAERWKKVEELFGAALEITPDARAAFVASACGSDEPLRRELEALLASHRRAGDFIQVRAFDEGINIIKVAEPRLTQGHRIGPYEVIKEIGRGGMGAVYLAARADDQYKKRVAIKLIKRGMDSDDILRRFRTERQILASLDHPNIARLLDGGSTDAGVPYFVMEYVEGLPLMDYCDAQRLSTFERLKLFRKICAAVQHAHQNLVVHRDLKPGNILITTEGEPKLLDFGIAKFLNPEMSPLTIAPTATLMRLMTRDYASPEQVRGQPVTTSSDVYSLGVLLYRLLTGHHPYQFKTPLPQEIERVICETEPQRPSQMVSRVEQITTSDGTTSRLTPELVSGARDSEPQKLRRILAGDLDTIVLMAMRKEPSRRYSSVEQFSEDIRRYLEGLPVVARKDTFTYRASKFIRRNKITVAAAATVLLAILAGLTISIWQVGVAHREKAKAEAISSFLQNMLGAAAPGSSSHRNKNDLTVKEVLDDASKRLAAADLSGQPEIKAELLRTIGISYLSLGQYDLASQNLSSALAIETEIYGEDDLETLKSLVVMGELWMVRDGDYAKADKFYQRIIPRLRAEQKRGAFRTDFLMEALYNYALARRMLGDPKEAEMLLREDLALSPQAAADAKAHVGVAESVLALVLRDQGKIDQAENIIRAQLASIRHQSDEEVSDAVLAINLSLLGNTLMDKGEFAEAEANLREAEAIYRKLFDPSYVPLGDNLRMQADVLYSEQKYAEAEATVNEALKIYRASSGPGYINFPTALTIQGMIFSKTNRAAEAEKLLREAVQIRSEHVPEGHFLKAMAVGALGEFLTAQERFAEAEPLLLNSYESLKNSQATTSPRIRTALSRIIVLYEKWSKPGLAAQYRALLPISTSN